MNVPPQYLIMNSTGIIVLAAGNSTRLGSAKQLLSYKNKTLLQNAIDEAEESGATPIVVITGSHNQEISASITTNIAEIVFNKNWKEGMASGITEGLKKVIALKNDIKNVIIAVCDQPYISSSLFQQLYQCKNKNGKHIIASAYAKTIGTPVLFTQKYFDSLMNLQGDEGAKKILLANKDDVATIDFPRGNIDIDTKMDYEQLLGNQKHIS